MWSMMCFDGRFGLRHRMARVKAANDSVKRTRSENCTSEMHGPWLSQEEDAQRWKARLPLCRQALQGWMWLCHSQGSSASKRKAAARRAQRTIATAFWKIHILRRILAIPSHSPSVCRQNGEQGIQ